MSTAIVRPRGIRAFLSSNATLIAFLLYVLAAGGNPVAIRLSNGELPPFWGGAARLAAAAVAFWLVVLVRRIELPRGRALLGVLLYGVVGFGVALGCVYWSLSRVQAGVASVFLALVPLSTVLLASAHGLETLCWRKITGALIALVGIALLVRGGLGTAADLPLLATLLGLPLGLAEGSVIVKLARPGNPMATNAIAMSVGAAILAALSMLSGETWRLPATPGVWAALAYLVFVGSVLLFYLWLFILGRMPASRTSYGFVLMPLVSVSASVLLTGETVTVALVLGAAVALAGVWLGAIRTAPCVVPPLAEAESNACTLTC